MKRLHKGVRKRLLRQDLNSKGPKRLGNTDYDSSPQLSSEYTIYRIRCLPTDCTVKSLVALLESVSHTDTAKSDIVVRSLAYSESPTGAKVAVVRARNLLPRHSGQRTQWNLPILTDNDIPFSSTSQSTEIVIDTHFDGLTPLNSFDCIKQHQVNVVAIPGLGGHAFHSFKERNGDFMWLMDALPSDLAGAQIWIYGYDTELANSSSFQDLEALASKFRRSLIHLTTSEYPKVVPLIFIGHSLGGLILKEALIQMSEDPSAQAMSIHQATYGLLLFGCPNQGMDIKSLVPMCEQQVNLPFLFSLGRSSERLRQHCRAFHRAFAFPDSRIISLYETKLSPTAIEESPGLWRMKGPLEVLVDQASATHGRPGEDQAHDIQAINRTHSDLVKYERKDSEYGIVLGFLREFKLAAPRVIGLRRKQGITRGSVDLTVTDAEQKSRRDEIFKWLAPTDNERSGQFYLEDVEDARILRHPDTCQWIEPRHEYQDWMTCDNASQSSLLWIHAIPGAGKTVLASYLVDKAIEWNSSTVLYFFFKDGDSEKNTAIAAARALLSQLLMSDNMSHTHEVYQDLHKHKEKATHSRAFNLTPLWDVITRYSSPTNKLCIILDALDECRDNNKLLPHIIRLTPNPHVKVAFTSRREPEIMKALEHYSISGLAMGPEEVSDDIKVYVNFRVAASRILSDKRIRSRIVTRVNARSRGMFLWVRLVLDELESSVTINQVEYALSSLPEGLPEVYKRILRRLQTSLQRHQRQLCSRLLKWLVLAKRPLRTREAHEALRLEYASAAGKPTFLQNLLYSEQDLQSICGPLVTVRKQVIELIHLSAKEFLLEPAETSILSDGLEVFRVDIGNHSASIASSCIAYLGNKELAREFSPNDENSQDIKQAFPFIEYSCFNWISHVTEATYSALVDCENIIHRFLISRQSFFWIEKCFTFQRKSRSELRFEVQRLSDWAIVHDTELSPKPAVEDILSLFSNWSQTFLRLLENYGPMVEFRPGLIHQIDPRRFCNPTYHRLLEGFCTNLAIQRQDTIKTVTNSEDYFSIPNHRKLQLHVSEANSYALCYFDMKRNAIITVDTSPGTTPELHCQEIKTGRKLMPVVDTEVADSTEEVFARGAIISPGGIYLAIYYSRNVSQGTCASYTAIWALDADIQFGQRRATPWAQKVFSNHRIFVDRRHRSIGKSYRPIAFKANNDLLTPSGEIDIATGEETPFPDSMLENLEVVAFSGDGQIVVMNQIGTDLCILTRTESDGPLKPLEIGMASTFQCISHTGRFVVFTRPEDANSVPGQFFDTLGTVFDTHTSSTTDIKTPDYLRTTVACGHVYFEMTRDERYLVAVVSTVNHDMMEYIDEPDELKGQNNLLYMWRQDGQNLELWTSKSFGRYIMGTYFDAEEQNLYVVDKRRVWDCVDLKSRDLVNTHGDTTGVSRQHNRLTHRVSRTGAKLATFEIPKDESQPAIEIFEIDACKSVRLQSEYVSESHIGPYLFSPDLKFLFKNSIMIDVESSNFHLLRETPSADDWKPEENAIIRISQCDFSPDSSYFALMSYYDKIRGCVFQLQIWSLIRDTKRFEPFKVPKFLDLKSPACILHNCHKAFFHFHPQNNTMIVSLWWKSESTSITQAGRFTMTCFHLDLASSELTELEPYTRKSARVFERIKCIPNNDNDYAVRFSTDGSYAVFDPDRNGIHDSRLERFCIFYQIPPHLKSAPSLPAAKILPPWWHESGLSFRLKDERCGESRSLIVIQLEIAKGASLEALPLTYEPNSLSGADFTVIHVTRDQGNIEKEELAIVFCIPNGGIEVKYINKTLPEILEGSRLWQKHGGRTIGESNLSLEDLEDSDSEIEAEDLRESNDEELDDIVERLARLHND